MSKPVTRKSKAPKLPLLEGSLASLRSEYTKMGFTKPQAEVFAQYAYTQKNLLTRLIALEAVALAQMLGAVDIGGSIHMLSCNKRENRNNACNCGVAPTVKKGAEEP